MTQILPSPTAPLGSVRRLATWSASSIPRDGAILCRNVAPLISSAFSLLRSNVPVQVLGRDIAGGLMSLVKKMKADSIPELEQKINSYCERETRKLEAARKRRSAATIRDRCECVRIFCERAESVNALLRNIESLFADKSLAVTLCTIHRAKGLEWNDVFLLDPGLIPSVFATQPWQLEQENNLLYVAITRAKVNFSYIRSEGFRK